MFGHLFEAERQLEHISIHINAQGCHMAFSLSLSAHTLRTHCRFQMICGKNLGLG